MDSLKHIIVIDKKEDTILLTEILTEIKAPYEMHCFHNYLNAEEFLQFENIIPEIIFVGSGIVHLYGENRLIEFRNNNSLKKVLLVILIQSELCQEYLLKNTISNMQFLLRPFDLEGYKRTLGKLLLPEITNVKKDGR